MSIPTTQTQAQTLSVIAVLNQVQHSRNPLAAFAQVAALQHFTDKIEGGGKSLIYSDLRSFFNDMHISRTGIFSGAAFFIVRTNINKMYLGSSEDSALKLEGGSYLIEDFCISNGQDPKGNITKGTVIKITQNKNEFQMTFSDGRWWFGGKNCQFVNDSKITCEDPNNRQSLPQLFMFSHKDEKDMDTIVEIPDSIYAKWMSKIDGSASLNRYFADDKYKSLFYRKDDLPLLKDARGKIVLFKRFEKPQNVTFGIDWFSYFKQDETFSFTSGQTKYFIEDNYNETNTSAKLNFVKDNMNTAVKGDKKDFYLTFNSIAPYFPCTHTPHDYAWGTKSDGIDPAMNPSLIDFLGKNRGKKRWGVVALDYYSNNSNNLNNSIADYLIISNFNS